MSEEVLARSKSEMVARMKQAIAAEMLRLDRAEMGLVDPEDGRNAERAERRATVAKHWLTELHDGGDPLWQVPAYTGATHAAQFAHRTVQIRSLASARVLPRADRWLPRWTGSILREARKRAVIKGLTFTLSAGDMLWLVWRSEGRCELSRLPFDLARRGPGERRPFAPSLDRIDNGLGYTIENVRLVSAIANLAMNEWGVGPLQELADALVAAGSTKVERLR